MDCIGRLTLLLQVVLVCSVLLFVILDFVIDNYHYPSTFDFHHISFLTKLVCLFLAIIFHCVEKYYKRKNRNLDVRSSILGETVMV